MHPASPPLLAITRILLGSGLLLLLPPSSAAPLYPQDSNWEVLESQPQHWLGGSSAKHEGEPVSLDLSSAPVSFGDEVEVFLKALPGNDLSTEVSEIDSASRVQTIGNERQPQDSFDRWLYGVAEIIKDTPEAREYLGTLKREVVTPLRAHLLQFEGTPLGRSGSAPLRPPAPPAPRAVPHAGGDQAKIRDWIDRLTQPSSLILMATLVGLGMLVQRLRERFREKRQAQRASRNLGN